MSVLHRPLRQPASSGIQCKIPCNKQSKWFKEGWAPKVPVSMLPASKGKNSFIMLSFLFAPWAGRVRAPGSRVTYRRSSVGFGWQQYISFYGFYKISNFGSKFKG
jgi:hypothetical protein